MALVLCANCGARISEKAQCCPKCLSDKPHGGLVSCDECSAELPLAHKGPCPECGNPDIAMQEVPSRSPEHSGADSAFPSPAQASQSIGASLAEEAEVPPNSVSADPSGGPVGVPGELKAESGSDRSQEIAKRNNHEILFLIFEKVALIAVALLALYYHVLIGWMTVLVVLVALFLPRKYPLAAVWTTFFCLTIYQWFFYELHVSTRDCPDIKILGEDNHVLRSLMEIHVQNFSDTDYEASFWVEQVFDRGFSSVINPYHYKNYYKELTCELSAESATTCLVSTKNLWISGRVVVNCIDRKRIEREREERKRQFREKEDG